MHISRLYLGGVREHRGLPHKRESAVEPVRRRVHLLLHVVNLRKHEAVTSESTSSSTWPIYPATTYQCSDAASGWACARGWWTHNGCGAPCAGACGAPARAGGARMRCGEGRERRRKVAPARSEERPPGGAGGAWWAWARPALCVLYSASWTAARTPHPSGGGGWPIRRWGLRRTRRRSRATWKLWRVSAGLATWRQLCARARACV